MQGRSYNSEKEVDYFTECVMYQHVNGQTLRDLHFYSNECPRNLDVYMNMISL